MIKCNCTKKDCKIGIEFDEVVLSKGIFLIGQDGQKSYMMMDPNTVVALIGELRAFLLRTYIDVDAT